MTAGSQTSDRLGRWADRVAAASSVATVVGMIATPLLPQRGRGRKMLSSVVVTGMFATSTANAVKRWGPTRAAGAAAATSIATGVIERVGTRTGLPFGRYGYTDALRPQVAHVPVIVPLAWFGMGLPSREAAHAALGDRSTPMSRIALGSAAMTAWDLFLDPQMVGEGYWAWVKKGVYRGIPVSNYLGWMLTGLGIMAMFERVLPTDGTPRSTSRSTNEPTSRSIDLPPRPDVRLVGQYGYMSVMQTLGFARYFRDPVVAVVGGAAMLPTAVLAARNLMSSRNVR